MPERILDTRPQVDFEAGHPPGAVNIPLAEIELRIHELPPRTTPLIIYDLDRERASAAARLLEDRERHRLQIESGRDWLSQRTLVTGPAITHLWQAHTFLEESLPVIADALGGPGGRDALDLACGSGRDAVRLALAGFRVSAWDLLPDALDRASDLARRHGVSLTTRTVDLESGDEHLTGAWDLVSIFRYLHRPLIPVIIEAVRPGGMVIYETFLEEQRRRFGRPRRDAFLLQPGELKDAFSRWEILDYREGLSAPRQVTASLLARKPFT